MKIKLSNRTPKVLYMWKSARDWRFTHDVLVVDGGSLRRVRLNNEICVN